MSCFHPLKILLLKSPTPALQITIRYSLHELGPWVLCTPLPLTWQMYLQTHSFIYTLIQLRAPLSTLRGCRNLSCFQLFLHSYLPNTQKINQSLCPQFLNFILCLHAHLSPLHWTPYLISQSLVLPPWKPYLKAFQKLSNI